MTANLPPKPTGETPLAKLARLVDERTVGCPKTIEGRHSKLRAGESLVAAASCCHGTGRVPDPRHAALLALVREKQWVGTASGGRTSYHVIRTAYWQAAPEGALDGAFCWVVEDLPRLQVLYLIQRAARRSTARSLSNQVAIEAMIAALEKESEPCQSTSRAVTSAPPERRNSNAPSGSQGRNEGQGQVPAKGGRRRLVVPSAGWHGDSSEAGGRCYARARRV